jgi:hypothetical protein
MTSHLRVMIPAFRRQDYRRSALEFPPPGRHSSRTHHLDRSTECQLAIALTEMQITERQLGLVHVDGEITPTPSREVLYVTVSAMLSRRDCSSSFGGDFIVHFRGQVGRGTDVGTFGEREMGLRAAFVQVGRFQRGFPFVPGVEESLRRGRSAFTRWVERRSARPANNLRRRRLTSDQGAKPLRIEHREL